MLPVRGRPVIFFPVNIGPPEDNTVSGHGNDRAGSVVLASAVKQREFSGKEPYAENRDQRKSDQPSENAKNDRQRLAGRFLFFLGRVSERFGQRQREIRHQAVVFITPRDRLGVFPFDRNSEPISGGKQIVRSAVILCKTPGSINVSASRGFREHRDRLLRRELYGKVIHGGVDFAVRRRLKKFRRASFIKRRVLFQSQDDNRQTDFRFPQRSQVL